MGNLSSADGIGQLGLPLQLWPHPFSQSTLALLPVLSCAFCQAATCSGIVMWALPLTRFFTYMPGMLMRMSVCTQAPHTAGAAAVMPPGDAGIPLPAAPVSIARGQGGSVLWRPTNLWVASLSTLQAPGLWNNGASAIPVLQTLSGSFCLRSLLSKILFWTPVMQEFAEPV